jgi:hypothetical protein
VRVCVRERKREREREFNNESKKCKSESEFIEKSYIYARKRTLPKKRHLCVFSDFLPFRGQIFFPRVTVLYRSLLIPARFFLSRAF